MARQIKVLYSYTADDTQWNYITPGNYDESDPLLYGLADKLIERGIAQVHEGTTEQAPVEQSAFPVIAERRRADFEKRSSAIVEVKAEE